MTGKKGVIPLHVKVRQKVFLHPKSDHPVITILERIEDSRQPSLFFRHSLTSVIFMVLTAVICGATDWTQVMIMCEGMKEWLALYVDISGGIPCEKTFKDLFNMIKQESMEQALVELSSLIREKCDEEIVNFDGQTKRGTSSKYNNIRGIHLLNAWSVDDRICLGQLKVDDKSNEIPAMPKLMAMLELRNTIITADAGNTQKTTVEQAIKQEADYVLPVKDNQPKLLEEIILMFQGWEREQAIAKNNWEAALDKAREHRDVQRLEKLLKDGEPTGGACQWRSEPEKSHGRIVTRSCVAMPVGSLPAKEDWEGLKSIAKVTRQKIEENKVSHETVYYISSLEPDAAHIANIVRSHWDIESNLHWRLDVIMKQDESHYRDRIGAANLGIVYKMALNALMKEDTLKRKSVSAKRAAAAVSPQYRDKVLKKLF